MRTSKLYHVCLMEKSNILCVSCLISYYSLDRPGSPCVMSAMQPSQVSCDMPDDIYVWQGSQVFYLWQTTKGTSTLIIYVDTCLDTKMSVGQSINFLNFVVGVVVLSCCPCKIYPKMYISFDVEKKKVKTECFHVYKSVCI